MSHLVLSLIEVDELLASMVRADGRFPLAEVDLDVLRRIAFREVPDGWVQVKPVSRASVVLALWDPWEEA